MLPVVFFVAQIIEGVLDAAPEPFERTPLELEAGIAFEIEPEKEVTELIALFPLIAMRGDALLCIGLIAPERAKIALVALQTDVGSAQNLFPKLGRKGEMRKLSQNIAGRTVMLRRLLQKTFDAFFAVKDSIELMEEPLFIGRAEDFIDAPRDEVVNPEGVMKNEKGKCQRDADDERGPLRR